MNVLIINPQPRLACWIANRCHVQEPSWKIAVLSNSQGQEIARFQERRLFPNAEGQLQEGWFSLYKEGDFGLFDQPKEALKWPFDMILNFSEETAAISNKLAETAGTRLLFNASPMIPILQRKPEMSLTFLKNANIETYPFRIFRDQVEIMNWISLLDSPGFLEIESCVAEESLVFQLQPLRVDVVEKNIHNLKAPLIARILPSIQPDLMKFGVIFTGKEYVGLPFSVSESSKSLVICHLEQEAVELAADFYEKAKTMLSAIRFNGLLFVEIEKSTGKIYRITTKAHPMFWYLYLESLEQSISKFLFSCAKGLGFRPLVGENRLGVIHENKEPEVITTTPLEETDYIYHGSGDGSSVLVDWQYSRKGYRVSSFSSLKVPGLAEKPLCYVQSVPYLMAEKPVIINPEHLPDLLVYGLMKRVIYTPTPDSIELTEVQPALAESEKEEGKELCLIKEEPPTTNKSTNGSEPVSDPLPSPPELRPSSGRRKRKVALLTST